ncbi:hypothetical protein [Breoghania sp.]|uniref:hypothetical protein n=1 Tax=Breoghania sp. TaxID=2065378 RepID=UPI00262E4F2E|nr:hypothetical protein [Breoghania sp.]MDJ0932225.1 hypothetical protein [Breoghania sp.]
MKTTKKALHLAAAVVLSGMMMIGTAAAGDAKGTWERPSGSSRIRITDCVHRLVRKARLAA